ncbi:hypothetical protein D7B24_004772 [Verticillium nonalfalfae]|uniref:F-box domain-containing protein n=1 Tax=Verticillium nonalfalfae TaxID=1051616 RepID=A0A3M9YGR8_9PEZI|nr:uncharacterized protein D7B24_004772 [Verticillium nonalfalfae]RNJ58320.1 hypothetical protein D7B24_004772 [Verticillium nonalfalfae]
MTTHSNHRRRPSSPRRAPPPRPHTAKTHTSLAALPTDILLDIIGHLATAAPVARLAQTSKALHALVADAGWKAFLRHAFPTLPQHHRDDAPAQPSWATLARALTASARLRDRHAYVPGVYTDARAASGNFLDGYAAAHAHPFSPCVDARLVHAGTQELVVWGAGEDLVGRFRHVSASAGAGDSTDGRGAEAWFRLDGKTAGHRPVGGDVTAVKVGAPRGRLGLFVGRASGVLELVSAEAGADDAGRVIAAFDVPRGAPQGASWGSVGFVDLFPGDAMLVSGDRARLGVYRLPDEHGDHGRDHGHGHDRQQQQPAATYSFPGPGGTAAPRFLHAAKPLSDTTLACALGGDDEPLRLLTLTPAGSLVPLSTGKPRRLLSKLPSGGGTDSSSGSRQTTVRALEVLSPNVLLSAWDDGAVRLTDLRSPRAADALFRDRAYQPDEPLSSLLAWGGERFVAGSNEHAHLKVFDVRRPGVGYAYAEAAAPCRAWGPVPAPAAVSVTSATSATTSAAGRGARCHALSGRRCGFHACVRHALYRPSSVVILQPRPAARTRPARVHALAKAGDASGSFYVGLPGAVAEMRLGEQDVGVRPQEVRAAAVRGWRAEVAEYSFLEIGDTRIDTVMDWDGLAWSERDLGLRPRAGAPRLVSKTSWDKGRVGGEGAWHRWDARFWAREHFEGH